MTLPNPDNPRAHIVNGAPEPSLRTCDVCGQVYDLRKFDDAFHHDQHNHKPRAAKTDAA